MQQVPWTSCPQAPADTKVDLWLSALQPLLPKLVQASWVRLGGGDRSDMVLSAWQQAGLLECFGASSGFATTPAHENLLHSAVELFGKQQLLPAGMELLVAEAGEPDPGMMDQGELWREPGPNHRCF